MKRISSIKWTKQNIEHISKHNIIPEEIEEVCFNTQDKPFIRTGDENLHYVFGQTTSGRYLFIVVKFLRNGEVLVITARDMNNWERNYYKKRGK